VKPIYTIVDIETTGGSTGNLITEIAMVKTDGEQILDTYETLIDPESYIPKSISLLTGITNDMVERAPSFQQKADEIKAYLEGTIFIAHNVSFDYSIVKNHFDDLAIPFNMKKLCTVRLARGIIQGLPSYSLGKLCRSLGIVNHKRHRAMGDAQATATLFHLLMSKDEKDFIGYSLNQLNKETILPPNLSREEYDQLPETTGVYYMHGPKLEILYVGKAKNIKKRINTHFGEKTRKKSELLRKVHHVSFEVTGNELVAFLLESAEIKKHYPPYNKAQKSKRMAYYVSYYKGQDEVYRVDVFNKQYHGAYLDSFTSATMARDYLYQLVEKHGLCPKLTGLERTKGDCFKGDDCDYCSDRIDGIQYNERIRIIRQQNEERSLLIFGNGREKDEASVVYIKQGEYIGFAHIPNTDLKDPKAVIQQIKPFRNTADTKRIINQFLSTRIPRHYKLIEL
jgi:DNA polymerase-3 subunit epsilon